ncbi:MAG TPA: metal-dependent hydrolase [Aquabacterium sp.]|uniref:metal-dependent hydrolase n=1 Tax=Aquabacterium sp. TaxID=1872578 RepID=UPI002E3461EA|nr:metal-dependent hydrolase [Aquabacterium sp.]HEX5372573.1 metal-dependent hydrolase [Aquabacterium sp.]
MTSRAPAPDIIPREHLDFGLDGDIPRFWLAGDPFKTRLFDAMSTLFPVGERFFITCVRDFKDRITDPKLQQQIKDFTRQEAQHSMLHTRYNQRLADQGIGVDRILEGQERRLFGIIRKKLSREFSLGITAAAEHITAIMADAFVERHHILDGADDRIRALYVWHAMEEMEHKAVAYDVLTGVAQASYLTRVLSMLLVTILFPFHVFRIMRHMLQVDGFSRWERTRIWAKGLWWLYKPGGVFLPLLGQYFSYLKPGFHPWDEPVVPCYPEWSRLMAERSPIDASKQLMNYLNAHGGARG